MTTRFSRLLNEARARKTKAIGREYTSYKLSKDSGTTQSYAYRGLNGTVIPGREILMKWCDALECSVEDRSAIFHAAGYLSPEEMQALEEDEKHFAA
jgi:transcriptional regulator with XRE-family HTH domain